MSSFEKLEEPGFPRWVSSKEDEKLATQAIALGCPSYILSSMDNCRTYVNTLIRVPQAGKCIQTVYSWSHPQHTHIYINIPEGVQATTSKEHPKGTDLDAYRRGYFNIMSPGHYSVLDAFLNYIRLCCRIWQKQSEVFYAPFTVLSQGSCSGKTFLALNTANPFAVCYINLRSKSSIAPPLRTPVIADFFLSLTTSDDVLVFIRAYFRCISEKNIKLENFYHEVNSEGFWLSVVQKYSSLPRQSQLADYRSLIVSDVNQARGVVGLDEKDVFLFILDEARSMLEDKEASLFLKWRSAISFVGQSSVFFVLLDTTSKLSNFQPSKLYDPSLRIQQGYRLFQPFYFYSFTGPWPDQHSDSLSIPIEPSAPGQTPIVYNLLYAVKFSRPYFYRSVQILIDQNQPVTKQFWEGTLIRFAKEKLDPRISELEDSSKTAVLSCKLGLVPVDYDTTETLVSSFCGTLIHVAANRAALKVKYVPEPLLAEGATRLLFDEGNFNRHLHFLHNELINGRLTPAGKKGDLGEFVAQVYITRIKDLASVKVSYAAEGTLSPTPSVLLSSCCPISVRRFLNMIGYSAANVVTDLDHALLSFNCFQKIDTRITNDIIRDALTKCYAIIPMEDQEAFDFFIPIVSREGSHWSELVEKADNYSAIAIQVKNYKETISQKAALELSKAQCSHIRNVIFKNRPYKKHLGVVSIVMGVGKGITDLAFPIFIKEGNDLHVLISRFPFFENSISEETADTLIEMLNVKGVVTAMEDQMMELLNFAHPYDDNLYSEQQIEFTKYIYEATRSFQADRFGVSLDELNKIAKKRRKEWQSKSRSYYSTEVETIAAPMSLMTMEEPILKIHAEDTEKEVEEKVGKKKRNQKNNQNRKKK